VEKVRIPQMLIIGSEGRNNGKTTLATALIQQWKSKFPVIGLKVTTIQKRDGKCPRGGEGCGICSNLKGNFELLEETNPDASKDTSLLLSAGAEKVYWLKTLKSYMYEGIKTFLKQVHEGALIVCESNSLRNVVEPGGFIMLKNIGDNLVKKSAAEVEHMADIIVDYDIRGDVDDIIKKVKITNTQSGLSISVKDNI